MKKKKERKEVQFGKRKSRIVKRRKEKKNKMN